MEAEAKSNTEVNNCEDDIPQLEVRSPEKRVKEETNNTNEAATVVTASNSSTTSSTKQELASIGEVKATEKPILIIPSVPTTPVSNSGVNLLLPLTPSSSLPSTQSPLSLFSPGTPVSGRDGYWVK